MLLSNVACCTSSQWQHYCRLQHFSPRHDAIDVACCKRCCMYRYLLHEEKTAPKNRYGETVPYNGGGQSLNVILAQCYTAPCSVWRRQAPRRPAKPVDYNKYPTYSYLWGRLEGRNQMLRTQAIFTTRFTSHLSFACPTIVEKKYSRLSGTA